MTSVWVVILVGVLQELFEWLPVSSEGNVTLVLTAFEFDPEVAAGFSPITTGAATLRSRTATVPILTPSAVRTRRPGSGTKCGASH